MTVIIALALYTAWTLGAMVMLAFDACFAVILMRQERHYVGSRGGFVYWFMLVRAL